mmetsp:Transcript_5712/g.20084  ORF Transcript_5712/g.20084 Transcript_5712/m.20084 type:complete len:303 (+) Transcript_5712:400-1308(+)
MSLPPSCYEFVDLDQFRQESLNCLESCFMGEGLNEDTRHRSLEAQLADAFLDEFVVNLLIEEFQVREPLLLKTVERTLLALNVSVGRSHCWKSLDRRTIMNSSLLDRFLHVGGEIEVVENFIHQLLQPLAEIVQETHLTLSCQHLLSLLLSSKMLVVGTSRVLDPLLRSHPQLVLHQAELHALKAGGRGKEISEVAEGLGVHRLEHVELADQNFEDLNHPGGARQAEGDVHLLHALVREAAEHVEDGVELVEHLLEPELVRLVDDDEEHLVVDLHVVDPALGLLRLENLVQLQVALVVQHAD